MNKWAGNGDRLRGKTGTGYAIPNFPELIVAVSLQNSCAKLADCLFSPTIGKLGIA